MKNLVIIFCVFLIVAGMAGGSYLLYIFKITNKPGLPGLGLFVGLLATIITAALSTGVGVYFSEQSSEKSAKMIQEALYPDNFIVGIDFNNRGIRDSRPIPCDSQGLDERAAELISVQSQDMKKVRIKISNNSEYPASYFITYIYLSEKDFNQGIEHIKGHLKGFAAYSSSVMDVDPLALNIGENRKQLKGCAFLFPHIEGRHHSFIWPFELTLKNKIGYFVVRLRDNCFLFKIANEKESSETGKGSSTQKSNIPLSEKNSVPENSLSGTTPETRTPAKADKE